jgi:hypothetical protein
MRHVTIAMFVAALLLAASPLQAQMAPAAPAENLAAARELVTAMRATDQFKAMLPTIFQALKPVFVQDRPDVEKDYNAIMPIIISSAMKRVSEFADRLAGIYATNFSVGELRDLIAFYHTPTGQKLVARQPVIARASMAAGQQFGQTLVNDLKGEIGEELRKRGHSN